MEEEPDPLGSSGLSDMSKDLSNYAELFGESQDKGFKGTGKSGLTPIEPIDPSVKLSPERVEKAKLHDDFQRKILQGFTTQELEDAGCLDKPTARLDDLKVPIPPLLQRDKWIDSDILMKAYTGNWGGGRDDVWPILKPCLKSTATYLQSRHLALVSGYTLLSNLASV